MTNRKRARETRNLLKECFAFNVHGYTAMRLKYARKFWQRTDTLVVITSSTASAFPGRVLLTLPNASESAAHSKVGLTMLRIRGSAEWCEKWTFAFTNRDAALLFKLTYGGDQ